MLKLLRHEIEIAQGRTKDADNNSKNSVSSYAGVNH